MGPKIGATTVIIPHNASATCDLFFGKTASISVDDSGISGPPAMPCSTRNSTSAPSERDRPQQIEKTTKATSDIMNSRTRPNWRDSQSVSGTVMASATA